MTSISWLCLNFIYFTTITKQVIQLILIMLVGTDVCVRMVFVWAETGVPGGNPLVWLGDHMTISHADIYSILIYSFHRSHVSFQMIVMTQWCLNDIYTILCFCCFIYYCYNVPIDIRTWDVSSEFWFCRNNCVRVCVMVCGNYYTFHFLNCSRWVSVSNECSVKQM